MGGSHQGGADLRIDRDVEVSLDGLLLVPGFDLMHHPVTERLSNEAEGYVADPLFRKLRQLLLNWHVALEVVVAAPLGQDGLEVQALVLRDREVAELSVADKAERGLAFEMLTYRLTPEMRSLRK